MSNEEQMGAAEQAQRHMIETILTKKGIFVTGAGTSNLYDEMRGIEITRPIDGKKTTLLEAATKDFINLQRDDRVCDREEIVRYFQKVYNAYWEQQPQPSWAVNRGA